MGSSSLWLVYVTAKQGGYVLLLPWLKGEGRNPFSASPPPTLARVLNQLPAMRLPGGKAQEQQLLLNEVV